MFVAQAASDHRTCRTIPQIDVDERELRPVHDPHDLRAIGGHADDGESGILKDLLHVQRHEDLVFDNEDRRFGSGGHIALVNLC